MTVGAMARLHSTPPERSPLHRGVTEARPAPLPFASRTRVADGAPATSTQWSDIDNPTPFPYLRLPAAILNGGEKQTSRGSSGNGGAPRARTHSEAQFDSREWVIANSVEYALASTGCHQASKTDYPDRRASPTGLETSLELMRWKRITARNSIELPLATRAPPKSTQGAGPTGRTSRSRIPLLQVLLAF